MSMYFSYLNKKQIPWLYGLRFDKDTFSLSLDIALPLVEIVNQYIERNKEGIETLASTHRYRKTSFVLDATQRSFGYSSIATVEWDKQMVSIIFPICSKSRNREVRKKHFSKVCCTLSILFDACRGYFCINVYDSTVSTTSHVVQLFELQTITGFEMHSHALIGFVSPELRFFLSNQGTLPVKDLQSINDSFRLQSKRLYKYDGQSRLLFEEDGGFLVQVPGSACDIGVYGNERSKPIEQGVVFESHNVDSAYQQLGLLIGFATILDLYYQKHPERSYLNGL